MHTMQIITLLWCKKWLLVKKLKNFFKRNAMLYKWKRMLGFEFKPLTWGLACLCLDIWPKNQDYL